MKTFQFKYKILLCYRDQIVKQHELKLGELNSKAHWFAHRLVSIQEELKRAEGDLIAARKRGDLQKQNSIAEYIQTLQLTFPEIKKAREQTCQTLLNMKKILEDALMQRKIIENLKRRQYTAFLKQQEREEEFRLDEFRSTHYS